MDVYTLHMVLFYYDVVYNYILYRRVMLARQMMLTDLSLNAIAYQCGFNDYSNFLRMFRKLIGVSPSQFRKGLRGVPSGENQ